MDLDSIPVPAEELQRAHDVTVQLLHAGQATESGAKSFRVDLPDGKMVKVSLDGTSHSSGHRRGSTHKKTYMYIICFLIICLKHLRARARLEVSK